VVFALGVIYLGGFQLADRRVGEPGGANGKPDSLAATAKEFRQDFRRSKRWSQSLCHAGRERAPRRAPYAMSYRL